MIYSLRGSIGLLSVMLRQRRRLLIKPLFAPYAIAVVLVVLWLLGPVTSHVMGGFIHVLLAIAVGAILFRVISGRRKVRIKV